MRVAILGSQGVPAKYGGFETMVENIIGGNCSSGIKYTVFCSGKDYCEKLDSYKGAELRYIPFQANGAQSIIYDILSLFKVLRGYDTVLLLGTSGCIVLPFFKMFFRNKLIINIDGSEYKRGKWGRFTKEFLRLSESLAIKYADIIVTDNKGIQKYVWDKYQKKSRLIEYGGDHAFRIIDKKMQHEVLRNFNLTSGNYSIKISRIEPENNCQMILDAFVQTGEHFVFIGNWSRNIYSRELRAQFSVYSNIHFIDSLFDLDILYVLRKHSKFYIHGHSAGGTNPSLLEAMFLGCTVFAYDVIYNKETTEYKANYFGNIDELIHLLSIDSLTLKENGIMMEKIAKRRYTWTRIASLYEEIY